MAQFTVLFNEQRYGPHSAQEIASMLASGAIDQSAMVWCDGWPKWMPVSTVAVATAPPAAVPQAPIVPIASQRRRPRGYKQRVGKRSFIFQIVLMVWTVVYAGLLVSAFASMASRASDASSSSSSGFSSTPAFARRSPLPSVGDLFDLSTGFLSGTICVGMGWCVIGLPVGVAAIATLRDEDAIAGPAHGY